MPGRFPLVEAMPSLDGDLLLGDAGGIGAFAARAAVCLGDAGGTSALAARCLGEAGGATGAALACRGDAGGMGDLLGEGGGISNVFLGDGGGVRVFGARAEVRLKGVAENCLGEGGGVADCLGEGGGVADCLGDEGGSLLGAGDLAGGPGLAGEGFESEAPLLTCRGDGGGALLRRVFFCAGFCPASLNLSHSPLQ